MHTTWKIYCQGMAVPHFSPMAQERLSMICNGDQTAVSIHKPIYNILHVVGQKTHLALASSWVHQGIKCEETTKHQPKLPNIPVITLQWRY